MERCFLLLLFGLLINYPRYGRFVNQRQIWHFYTFHRKLQFDGQFYKSENLLLRVLETKAFMKYFPIFLLNPFQSQLKLNPTIPCAPFSWSVPLNTGKFSFFLFYVFFIVLLNILLISLLLLLLLLLLSHLLLLLFTIMRQANNEFAKISEN